MRIAKYRTELVKEAAFDYEGKTATSPAAVYDILKAAFNAPARLEEHVWQICVNAQGRCVGLFELATGTITQCVIDTAGLIRNALLCNAYAFIVAHNHPSGDPAPSDDDIRSTKRIAQAAQIVGVKLRDHIIIGDGKQYSMQQDGIL